MSKFKIPDTKIPDSSKSEENNLNRPVLNVDYSKVLKNDSKSKTMLFSFALLNKGHELFNLGDSETREKHLDSQWYVDLLEQLSTICVTPIADLKTNNSIQLHPLDLKNTNIRKKDLNEQYDYYQFRINKKSRVIGIKIDNIFYVIWLDPHHNHFDSEGYGGIKRCIPVSSTNEMIQKKDDEIHRLNEELKEYKTIFEEEANKQYKV